MPFTLRETCLNGLMLLDLQRFGDQRGWFMETFQQSAFEAMGIDDAFVQDNCSRSTRGVLRGLHFQRSPHTQGKLVAPIEGRIFDVMLDLRPNSPTRGQWRSFILDADSPQALWAPPGFAHGFQTLSDTALFIYKVTAEYAPHSEGGVRWDDPDLAIPWPVEDAILSERDRNWPLMREL